MEYAIIIVILLFIYMVTSSRIKALENQIKSMKVKIDQLSINGDVQVNPVDDDIRKLLHEGKDVRAVKAVRDALGLSLLDAKQYVDAIKKEMDEKK
ncbi:MULTISPECIES: hypothetical protein [Metabacillus]|uniref:Uncharacterized protein n=1 Tax=Metabacillus hrfriensis TaxID=3048891 RepID=A0ACD4RFD9_9BACI|nr:MULTISPECIES: hypothetical protein [Metabacillus]UAL53600.1 hypothetical protein K8L98_07395 [Metabacillus dongyingensis]UOK59052.1 hypothetical protein MGI18_08785 [Bacillus sp. OVS6]WHZ59159.1 hypothetical protein QLQ22_07460 [Metabacillus sp. CT-WN-B3]